MLKFKKGYIPWNKGKHHSEESKRKISEWNKGKKLSEETRGKISEASKGRKVSEETRKRLSKANKGKRPSEETRRKMSDAKKANPTNYWLGKKRPSPSEETKRKMGEARRGEKNGLWKGGKSFEPYTTDWTRTLRRSIRERDGYHCGVCGRPQEDRAFDCHHIDYKKENCNPNNLIALCQTCHKKTNFNRVYWQECLNKIMEEKENGSNYL